MCPVQPLARNDQVIRTKRAGEKEHISYAISHQLQFVSRRTDVRGVFLDRVACV